MKIVLIFFNCKCVREARRTCKLWQTMAKMAEFENYMGKWKDDCWKARVVFLLYFKFDSDFLSFDDNTCSLGSKIVGTFVSLNY